MKFKTFFLILFLFSCTNNNYKGQVSDFKPYSSKGFVLIFSENDYKDKIITSKLDEKELQIGHSKLKKNSIVILTNPQNKKSIQLTVSKKIKYPDFFKGVITNKVAKHLDLNPDLPFVDIQERVRNKSFVAKKAVTFFEEKRVSNKAPITQVKIDNISKMTKSSSKKTIKYSIIVGNFYSRESTAHLIDLLINENIKKEVFKVKKLKKNKYQLTAGPYSSINTLKNDYFKLNKYGFDNLDIKQND